MSPAISIPIFFLLLLRESSALPLSAQKSSDGYCLYSFMQRCTREDPILVAEGIANIYGCDEKCFESADCNWWTFTYLEDGNGRCELFNECSEKTNNCVGGDCYLGERNCHGGFAADTFAAIIGGKSDQSQNADKVEVLRRQTRCSENAIPALPESRDGHTATAVNTEVFVCGGTIGATEQLTSSCLSYSTESSDPTWSEVSDMSQARVDAAAVEAYGEVLVIGGHDGSEALSTVEALDAAEKTWTALPPMPEPRAQHCAVRVRDVVYVVGGVGGADTQVFNLTSRMWSRSQDQLSTPRRRHACAVVKNPNGGSSPLLLAAGGISIGDETVLSSVEVLDLGQERPSWSEFASLTLHRHSFSLSALQGALLAVGGETEDRSVTGTAEMLDWVNSRWELAPQLDLNSPRSGVAAAGLDYLAGGCRR